MQARLRATLDTLPGSQAARGFYSRDRRVAGSVLAAGVALRFFLTLLPLALLGAAAIGFMKPSGLGSPTDVAQRAGLTASLAATIRESAGDARGGRWYLLALGLLLLLWASVSVYRSLLMVHAVSWGLPPPRGGARLRSLAVVSGGVFLLSIVTLIPNALRVLDPRFVPPSRLLLFFVYAGLWLVITWYLPHGGTSWRDLLPGAIVFAVGVELLQLLMAYTAAPRVAHATRLYGAIGIVSVSLAVLLVLGRLIIASAHLNALLWERQQGQKALERLPLRTPGRLPN